MKKLNWLVVALVGAYSLGAVELVDGTELTVGAGKICTVSGTYTIPRFVNNGTLTLAEGAELTIQAAENKTSSRMAEGMAVNASLNLETGSKLSVLSYNTKDSNEGLAIAVMGGTGTVNVAAGAYLSVAQRLRFARNSANDRTPLTYAVMNIRGTVKVGYAELSGFWPNDVTDTNLFHHAAEINLFPGGSFSAGSIAANDAAIVRINMRGGTLGPVSSFYAGFGAIYEIDFAADTVSTITNAADLALYQFSIVNVTGSGTLVKKGRGTLTLFRPAGKGFNAFTGNIRVEQGSVYLGRALAEGQTVYVCKGASYVMAVPEDSAKITYEDETERPAASRLYTVNADIDGGLDLVSMSESFDADRLGGPTRPNVMVTVRGTVAHAAATVDAPFELVGQNATGTLAFDNSELEAIPLLFSGAGVFQFPGSRDLRWDADATRLRFAGGTYAKSDTVAFLSGPNGQPYRLEDGSVQAARIFIGADGENGEVVVSGGHLRATDVLYLGSNRGEDLRHYTFGSLTITNGSASSVNEMHFGAYSPTDGSSQGKLYGRLTLQKDATLAANVILNDEGSAEILYDGGVQQLRANGKHVAFAVNQTGCLTLRATNGHDIVLSSVGVTNSLAAVAAAASPVRFTGEGGLVFQGAGQITLEDAGAFTMDYSGDTVVKEGRVRLGVDNPFPSGVGKGELVVKKANALDLNGHTLRVNNFTCAVSNAIVNASSVPAEIDVGADNRDLSYMASLSDGIALGKVGTGTMDLRSTLPQKLVVKEGTARVGTPTYSHYRFKVEKAYGASANSIQFAELKLLCNGEDVTRPFAAVSRAPMGKDSPSAENPTNAVDGVLTTKFLDFNGANDSSSGSAELRDNCWLQLDYDAPVSITHYTWALANDHYGLDMGSCRNPKNWRLQGSSDGVTWVDLDVQTDYVVSGVQPSSWIKDVFAVGAKSRAGGSSVQVGAAGVLELDGTVELSSLVSEGRTTLAAGTTLLFTDSGTCTGSIEGQGTLEKRGTGTLTMDVDESFTGSIVAREGNVCFSEGITSKWFRFTVRKTNLYAGEAMQFSEFKLLDATGARQGLNLAEATTGTAADRLAPGTFCVAAEYKTGSSSEGLVRVFDGLTNTKWCVIGVKDLIDGKESAWRTFTLRLPEDATPIVAYNLTTANDALARTPSSWLLETSADGIIWQTLDDRTEVSYPSTLFTDLNGGTPFPLTVSTESKVVRATVEAAEGVTVCVRDETTQLSALRIDCTAGAGTFAGVSFAAEGALYLTNAGNLGTTATLPMTLTDARNAENVCNWKVYVDGVLKPGWKVSVSGTTLRLAAGGTLIYVR